MKLNETNGAEDPLRIVMLEIAKPHDCHAESPFEPDISRALESLVVSTAWAMKGLIEARDLLPEAMRGTFQKIMDEALNHADSWRKYITGVDADKMSVAEKVVLLRKATSVACGIVPLICAALQCQSDTVFAEMMQSVDRMEKKGGAS